MSHLMNTYARLPVAFSHGEGAWLWDTEGKRYLDALSGIAVNTLGHAHPRFTAALNEQIGKMIHCSNIYQVREQELLADKLCGLAAMQEVFFCNSGCEANEAAIKLARMYGHKKGIESPAIIVMEKAFHGRTLATLSATGNRKVQAGFEPLVSGFVRVPYNDLEAVRQVAQHNSNVVAVLIEPIQGEGGVRTLDIAYLQQLRTICNEQNWLLMLDEVQCGLGRTGKWFAFQHTGILPDVMTLAKGLGSGIPIGACLTAGNATGTLQPGNHGSTFGGNSLACAVARAALDAAVAYAREREQFGQPIARFQGVQFMLADMAMQVHGARLMVHHAAGLLDRGAAAAALESSMAKCFAGDAAMRVTTDAVQVLGGYGYTRESPVERFMRDAKITQIYEGTNQIQRLVIARELARRTGGRIPTKGEMTGIVGTGEQFTRRQAPRPFFEAVLARAESPWYDDTRTPEVETRDDLVRRAMREALDETAGRAWGEIATLTFAHPMARVPVLGWFLRLSRGPFPWGGSAGSLNSNFFRFDASGGYIQGITPAWRQIVDFADVDNALMAQPAGQSGNPMSPHFFDFWPLWRTGSYWKVPLSRERVRERLASTLVLEPAQPLR